MSKEEDDLTDLNDLFNEDEISSRGLREDSDVISSMKMEGEAGFYFEMIQPKLKDELLNKIFTKEFVIGNLTQQEVYLFEELTALSQDCLIMGLERTSKILRGYALDIVLTSRSKDGFQQKIIATKIIQSLKQLSRGDKQEKGLGAISNKIRQGLEQ